MAHDDGGAVFRPLHELARELGISRRTLYRRIDSGDVEVVTVGGQRMARSVARAMAQRATETTAPPAGGTVARGAPSRDDTDLCHVLSLFGTLARERHELAQRLVEMAEREADRERRAALEARELADLYRARAERAARLAGELVRLPWYAMRERRRIRAELEALEAEPARLAG